MKKGKKICIILAACCIVVGGVMTMASVAMAGFDFSKFNSRLVYKKTYSIEVSYQEKTYTAESDFDQIEISTEWENVQFVPSEDGTCKVVCPVKDDADFTVEVKDNTLRVIKNEENWQENLFNFQFSAPEDVTLYLPQNTYQNLSVKTASGNVILPSDFVFTNVDIYSASGNLEGQAQISQTLNAESVSGNVSVQKFAGDKLELKTNSGDIHVQDSTAKTIGITSVSGNVSINRSGASENAMLQLTSGDVDFVKFDAPKIEVTTVSGCVEGSLLSGKQFFVNSLSGDVQVPQNQSQSQTCTISTTSGDVRLTIG